MTYGVYCASHRHLKREKALPKPEEPPPEIPTQAPAPLTQEDCQSQIAQTLVDLRAGKMTSATAKVLLDGLRGLQKSLPEVGATTGDEEQLTDEQLAAALRQQLLMVEQRIRRKRGNGHGEAIPAPAGDAGPAPQAHTGGTSRDGIGAAADPASTDVTAGRDLH